MKYQHYGMISFQFYCIWNRMMTFMLLRILMIYIGIRINAPFTMNPRVIDTKYGKLQGFIVTLPGRYSSPVEVYLGVPYARPPLAEFRFLPPVTPPPWDGVRKANKMSPVCPQTLPNIDNETEALQHMPKGRLEYLKRLLPYLQVQSEDCLYLNIYSPYQGKQFSAESLICSINFSLRFNVFLFYCFGKLILKNIVFSFFVISFGE